MSRLAPGVVVDVAALVAAHESVPAEQVLEGASTVWAADLDDDGARTVGVWELTPGRMSDVEVDEVFVVVAGDATVSFEEPALPDVELGPGSILRLTAGMRTVWTVRETLRKVYLLPPGA